MMKLALCCLLVAIAYADVETEQVMTERHSSSYTNTVTTNEGGRQLLKQLEEDALNDSDDVPKIGESGGRSLVDGANDQPQEARVRGEPERASNDQPRGGVPSGQDVNVNEILQHVLGGRGVGDRSARGEDHRVGRRDRQRSRGGRLGGESILSKIFGGRRRGNGRQRDDRRDHRAGSRNRHPGDRRAFRGFNDGRGFGQSVLGQRRSGRPGNRYEDFLERKNALREAQRQKELLEAEDERRARDQLQYGRDQGHRAEENRNKAAEVFARGQSHKNRDESHEVFFESNKEVHKIDKVNLQISSSTSESSGNAHDKGARVQAQHNREGEGHASERLQTETEEQERQRLLAAAERDHQLEAEDEHHSQTNHNQHG